MKVFSLCIVYVVSENHDNNEVTSDMMVTTME